MKKRTPAVAGAFYPATKEELKREINEFLRTRTEIKNAEAIISPHAGYYYSGRIAGKAFASLKKAEKIIILGPIHTFYYQGICTLEEEYTTPLGAIKTIIPEHIPKIKDDYGEHSIEVQIPFIQATQPKTAIIPIMVGSIGEKDEEKTADKIEKIIDEKTAIVVSSDLSHYKPEETAKKVDRQTIKNIINLKTTGINACGENPIKILNIIAKRKKWKAKLLEYTTSGEKGNKQSVVGYAAIAYEK
ncbi:AmmeMemoRadiSam system protein B [Candidatus Woesearchaeota archaeon ex4484_78]|nr:MAG: AmmeMemoRadiSam system protein B [Candidatus Woesearchaeota archaeon ex4484_78]